MSEDQLAIGDVVTISDPTYVKAFGTEGVIYEKNGDKCYVSKTEDGDGFWLRVADLSPYDPDAEVAEEVADDHAEQVEDEPATEGGSDE